MRCTATIYRDIPIPATFPRYGRKTPHGAHIRVQPYRCTLPYGHQGEHRAKIDEVVAE